MKNILLLSTVLTALLLASCSKEGSFEDPTRPPGTVDTTGGGTGGGGTTPTGNQLYRIGTKVVGTTDSITTDYGYNAAGFLTRFAQGGTLAGTAITAEVRYVRNAANIITQSITKSNAFAQLGFDSVVAQIYYDAATARYTHAVGRIYPLALAQSDSAVFAYTAGKVSSLISYHNDGSGYEPDTKEEYSYTGANLMQIKNYIYDDGSASWELEKTTTSQFDSRINPTSFPADAPVMSLFNFYSANNTTKLTVLEAVVGQPEESTNIYTYNAANRPLTAVSSTSGVVTSESRYYYR